MSGSLTHLVSQIIQQLLIDLAIATNPDDGDSWPVYATQKTDSPNNQIWVTDTESKQLGRTQYDGEISEQHGFQVMVRAEYPGDAYSKAQAIKVAFDTSVKRTDVVIESTTYKLHCVNRTTDVVRVGNEDATGRRKLFSINAVVSVHQQAGTGT